MTQEDRDQILLSLKKGQEELFKGQEELFKGQEELFKGQEKLFKGQEKLFKGQEKLFKGQEERDQILLSLKKGQEELLGRVENLENGLKYTNQELTNLSGTVAKIEIDHGHKLEILLDVVTSHTDKFESIEKILNKHEKKLNKHADEIYYLNSKVHAF